MAMCRSLAPPLPTSIGNEWLVGLSLRRCGCGVTPKSVPISRPNVEVLIVGLLHQRAEALATHFFHVALEQRVAQDDVLQELGIDAVDLADEPIRQRPAPE